MSEPKSFASLSSGLLARKGQAKPAMRPQAYGAYNSFDDLGWNDMGYPHHADIPHQADTSYQADQIMPADDVPAVVSQQAEIAEELGVPVEAAAPQPITAKSLIKPKRATAQVVPIVRAAAGLAAARSAFTLRLDPERHLRLRLACAVDHRSAQQVVTQALDEYLAAKPEIDALAGSVPLRGKH